jgi:PAS domain S-box-containing protein
MGATAPHELGLLDHVDVAVFATDPCGRLMQANPAWVALVGTPVEPGCVPLWQLLHPADRTEAQARVQALAAVPGSGAAVWEARLPDTDTQPRWVRLRLQGLVAADGTVTGLCGTAQPLPYRSRAADPLRPSSGALNTLLANVPGMAYRGRNDPDWTMDFVSDGCLDLTGYEAHELIGNACTSFGQLIHPEDREFVWTQVQAHVAQRRPYRISYRIRDAAGRERWVWEQGRGVFSSLGELLAVEGFITDVSERRGAEERARRRLWFESRTGLASRALFDELLAWTLEHGRLAGHRCALLCVDAHGIRQQVQRLGPEAGEAILTEIGRRVRPVRVLGAATYLGEHRFAVLVTDFRLGGALQAVPAMREALPAISAIASRLAQSLMQPMHLGAQRCTVEVSVGIALSQPRYAGAEAFLRAAQEAAQQAAEMGSCCEVADT